MLFLSVLILIITLIIIYFFLKKSDILLETTSLKKEIPYTKFILKKKNDYNISYIGDEMDSGWSINFWVYLKSMDNNISGKKILIQWDNLNIYIENLNIVFEIPLIDKRTQKILFKNLCYKNG